MRDNRGSELGLVWLKSRGCERKEAGFTFHSDHWTRFIVGLICLVFGGGGGGGFDFCVFVLLCFVFWIFSHYLCCLNFSSATFTEHFLLEIGMERN